MRFTLATANNTVMWNTITNDPGDSNPARSLATYDYADEAMEPSPGAIDGAAPVCRFKPSTMVRLNPDLKESLLA